MPLRFWVMLSVLAAPSAGQRLLVYSEFQRLGPDGQIVAADRTASSHEFISPAIPRGGTITLRLGVEAPQGTNYSLYVGQNPDNTAECRLHQERYVQIGQEWVPDGASSVQMPHTAMLAQGQSVQSYLLDIHVPASVKPQRFRLEIQLNVGERWVIYPMEMRVRDVVVRAEPEPIVNPPRPDQRADSAVLIPLMGFICGTSWKKGDGRLSRGSDFVTRNVMIDLLLAQERAKQETRDAVVSTVLKAGGYPSRESFCARPSPIPAGPEWWLKVRNYLYQGVPIQ